MTFRWYNPLSWRFFGYDDPKTGEYVEVEMAAGGRTKAGVIINRKNAMTIPIAWACIRVLADSISTLPLKLYVDKDGKREPVKRSARQARLLRKPNPYMTMLTFLKCCIVHLATIGNHFCLIERNDKGEWIGLIPLDPDTVRIDTDDGLLYWIETKGKQVPVSPENMLHFKIFSFDGITGLSPVEFLRESMGLAKSAEEWSARFMRKGGFAGGYMIYDRLLTDTQRAQIYAKFPDIRANDTDDIGKVTILEGGPKYVPAAISQKDSQFLESRQFQDEELAGIWGVPLHLTMRASKTSILGSNLEQQNAGFVTYGLRPYLKAIEDEMNDKLFADGAMFVEFIVEGLLRGDTAARQAYYSAALGGSGGSGWMAVNEVREKENLPRLEGEEYDRVTRWEMPSANQA